MNLNEIVPIVGQNEKSNVFCADIWEKIAEYLNLSDLINLAYVCVDARTAARLVYKKKYKSKGLVIRVEEKKPELNPSEETGITIMPQFKYMEITTFGLKTAKKA